LPETCRRRRPTLQLPVAYTRTRPESDIHLTNRYLSLAARALVAPGGSGARKCPSTSEARRVWPLSETEMA
jgi:hypothetical protein